MGLGSINKEKIKVHWVFTEEQEERVDSLLVHERPLI